MSWVYWGIVGGLAAMVATIFVCVSILNSNNVQGSPKVPNSKIDEPREAVKDTSVGHRQAA
jgi:hypothetical protein